MTVTVTVVTVVSAGAFTLELLFYILISFSRFDDGLLLMSGGRAGVQSGEGTMTEVIPVVRPER